MKTPRAVWLLAPLLIGAGLLLFFLRGVSGPDVPDVAPLEALPPSNLTVWIAYGLAGLGDELEAELPVRIGDLGSRLRYPGDPRLEYAFEAERGPLELSASGDTVRVVTELEYGGQVWYATPLGVELTTGCGIDGGELAGDAPRAAIQISFPLVVDETWTVRSLPSVDRVEPASESDRCLAAVLGFEVDATDAIMLSLRDWLEEEAESVGAQIESVSPRPYAEEWWNEAQSPIEVASNVWLLLDPEALTYRIGGDPESPVPASPGAADSGASADLPSASITGEIGATVRPRIVVGPRPEASRRDLPPLALAPAPTTDSTSGWVTVDGFVGFVEASEIVGAGVEGVEWQTLGRTFRVASADLSGSGEGRVALAIELAGDVPASLRLVGTPVIDSAAGEITVPDLEVTIESGGPLPRVIVWGARNVFPRLIRERARFPIERLLPPGLDEGIEIPLADGATLDASLTGLEVTDVATTAEGVLVRARIRTDAELRVDP